MKILLASFDPVPAAKGAARHILRNHAILTGLGHEVSLLTLGDHGPLAGMRHIALAPEGDTWLERAVAFHHACREVLARNAFDVVHVRSPFEGLAVPPDVPVVYEVNALYSVEIPVHYPDLLSQPGFREKMRANELLLLDRAAAVITPSPVTARYLEDLGVPDAHVVPNCPSIDRVEPAPPAEGPVRLVYLGTLSPWQGLHQGLRCLGRLTDLDWTLDVLSGSRRNKWVHKLVAKQGLTDRVRLREPLEPRALGPYLAGCHLGLAPLTPSERNLVQGCMPVKLLDYMRAGLPVLAPDIEVVTHVLGRDTPLYRAWSRTHLTETLQTLITAAPEQRRLWGDALRMRVEARFPEQVQAEALAAVYAGVA